MISKYKQLALSTNTDKVIDGLSGLINSRSYCLSEAELVSIEKSSNNELVSGWVFAYQIYSASANERNELLKKNINNPNPRIREQVCDIIGDEFIEELREYLKQLFNDPVDYVSAAAKYNHN